ncbi:hypothetical protein H4R18_005579 [Coemansia javaensis]|uniref:Amino acid transporter transmembrane domain-containing protein n=1 Tax=Coemansia javaensis TaxID=2761396 RepID=A0A9W8LEL6_9FUNG|nr:hypothetical protein H4R18_005579 [Coemansia javaensis]
MPPSPPSDAGGRRQDQPERLPPNAQQPIAIASSSPRASSLAGSPRPPSLTESVSRRLSQATELLATGTSPAGASYMRALGGSGEDDEAPSGSDAMVLPEAEAARRLKRHLVTRRPRSNSSGGGDDDDDDDSEIPVDPFTLPSGDITHQLYRWQEEHSAAGSRRGSTRRGHVRTHSLSAMASDSEWDVSYTPNQMRAPGGFRRQFVREQAERRGREANILTANFVDFIGLYGHFAGGDYPSDEDDPDDDGGDAAGERPYPYGVAPSERSRLLGRRERRQRPQAPAQRELRATASPRKAFFLLVKAFVGTGVLVLPRAFFNGGLLFSSVLMSGIAWYALHCMILLADVYQKVGGSYGDLALKLYGPALKYCVLVSIVLAQLGFCCAYVIFVATNMRDLWNTVTACKRQLSLEAWIVVQLLIYVPLSFVRRIKRFASLSMVGNLFILVGLGYLFAYDLWLIAKRGPAEVVQFNPSKFPLLVGTAAFSYEGISLVIPIVETMERKDRFRGVLTASLTICAALFVLIGALSYMALGSAVETVVLLNLPAGSAWTLGVQLLYSLAIIMSVPLQLFPAIRIIEAGIFTRSGKGDPVVKWQKNLFRTLLVAVVVAVAIFGAEELDNFIAIVGAAACLPLSFLYPVMLHYRALATTWWARLKDLVLVAVALAGLVYVTYISIDTWGSSAPPLDRCATP